MPPKKDATYTEVLEKLNTLNEKLTTVCTPEKFKSKVSELFAELREAHSEYNERLEKVVSSLSDLLNDPSIWISEFSFSP